MTVSRSTRFSETSALPRRVILRGLAGGGLAALAGASGRRLAGAAQDASPVAVPPLFAEWLAIWGSDPAGAEALYTDDAILEDVAFGTSFRGLAALRDHIEDEFVGFPDHAYELHTGFVAGDFASAELTFTATYTGTYPGLPPGEGQAVSLRVAAVCELADGKIRREAHYYDAYAFLIQLGLLPASGTEAAADGTPDA